jgi:AraC-like DNA-binding protein
MSLNKGNTEQRKGIAISCYYNLSREGEHFVPEHTLSYQISGSLALHDGNKEYGSTEGSFRLIRRNQLLRFIKQPPANGEFRSLSIYFDQQVLKDVSAEYELVAECKQFDKPVLGIQTTPLLRSYIDSLIAYHETDGFDNQRLVKLKLKEGILLLLKVNPDLKNVLFDFTEPFKIDLEEFMNRNYHFNAKVERFAYLTGRSLATFKRDFKKTFNMSPHQWILKKRLNQAYYLITKRGKKSSDIYMDLGFEDLSHFSFVFKKEFGETPSQIR